MIYGRIKFSESNFNQSLSWTLDLFPEILSNILGILANWARWSEMVVVKLPEFCLDWSITFENMLSIRVLEWQVMLVGYKIAGKDEVEKHENLKIHWPDYTHCYSRG